jgi:hypothetical protein
MELGEKRDVVESVEHVDRTHLATRHLDSHEVLPPDRAPLLCASVPSRSLWVEGLPENGAPAMASRQRAGRVHRPPGTVPRAALST